MTTPTVEQIETMFSDDVPSYIDLDSFMIESPLNTGLHYMYRDGANYKKFGTLIFAGVITVEQLKAIDDSLLRDEQDDDFLPRQVGIQPLCYFADEAGYNDDFDHPVHTLNGIFLTKRKPDQAMTLDELVSNFKDVGPDGWDEAEYGNIR